MATVAAKKIKTLVECPLCKQVLTEPRILRCFHALCATCITKLMEINGEGEYAYKIGYECPVCKEYTQKEEVQGMQMLDQLVEMLIEANKEASLCTKCKENIAKFVCYECDLSMCIGCRREHDCIPENETHECQSLDNIPRPSKVMYCSEHKSEVLKLVCQDCNKVICYACNAEKHLSCHVEYLDKVLVKVMPRVRKQQDQINRVIAKTRERIDQCNFKREVTKEKFELVEKQIRAKFDCALQRLIENFSQLLHQNELMRNETAEEQQDFVDRLSRKLMGEEIVLDMTTSRMMDTHPDALVRAFESGLLLGGLDPTDKAADPPADMFMPDMEFHENSLIPPPDTDINMLGAVYFEPPFPTGPYPPVKISVEKPRDLIMEDMLTQDFAALAEKSFIGEFDVELPFLCRSLELFDFERIEVWCLEHHTNRVHTWYFDVDEKTDDPLFLEGGMLSFSAILKGRSLRRCLSFPFICASNGLFIIKQRSMSRCLYADASFCDMSSLNQDIYALNDTRRSVQQFRFEEKKERLIYVREFSVVDSHISYWNTIQHSEENIFVAIVGGHIIQRYNNNGKMKEAFARKGVNFTEVKLSTLCSIDPNQCMLVAGHFDDKIEVFKPSGRFLDVLVHDLGKHPLCAKVIGERLVVTSRDPNILQVFKIGEPQSKTSLESEGNAEGTEDDQESPPASMAIVVPQASPEAPKQKK